MCFSQHKADDDHDVDYGIIILTIMLKKKKVNLPMKIVNVINLNMVMISEVYD